MTSDGCQRLVSATRSLVLTDMPIDLSAISRLTVAPPATGAKPEKNVAHRVLRVSDQLVWALFDALTFMFGLG